MSAETNKLLSLFSKLLHNPNLSWLCTGRECQTSLEKGSPVWVLKAYLLSFGKQMD